MRKTDVSAALRHFSQTDSKIAGVLDSVTISSWLEERIGDDYFYHLTRNIVGQQLAGKAAAAIFARFETLAGSVAPEKIVAIPDQSLRDAGLSWAKAKYIKDLAAKVISGEVALTDLDRLDDESVIEELTKVKGIGRWTAEMFLLFTLQRPDIFSHGDLGLRNGFIKLYGIADPSREEIERVVSRWSPFRSYGSIALWHYLDNT